MTFKTFWMFLYLVVILIFRLFVLQNVVQKDIIIFLFYFITDFLMILLWLFTTRNQLIGNVYIFLCYRKKNIFGTNVYQHRQGNPRYIAVQDLNQEKSAMSWHPSPLTRHHNHEPSPSEKEEFLQKLRKININIHQWMWHQSFLCF